MQVDLHALVQDLPVGLQQRVEILKALYRGARVLVLDEPTGVLTPQETQQLFEILKSLRAQGVTILLITHKLKEIMAVTDRVSVMRGGEMVAHLDTENTSPEQLAELMVGQPVLLSVGHKDADPGEICLKVSHLSVRDESGKSCLRDISFEVRRGEIFGIAGCLEMASQNCWKCWRALRRLNLERCTSVWQRLARTGPLRRQI